MTVVCPYCGKIHRIDSEGLEQPIQAIRCRQCGRSVRVEVTCPACGNIQNRDDACERCGRSLRELKSHETLMKIMHLSSKADPLGETPEDDPTTPFKIEEQGSRIRRGHLLALLLILIIAVTVAYGSKFRSISSGDSRAPGEAHAKYTDIRKARGAQHLEEMEKLNGCRVTWEGRVTKLKESLFGQYEVFVEMKEEGLVESFQNVRFSTDKSRYTHLVEGGQIRFTGFMESITPVMGIDYISLKNVEILDVPEARATSGT